MKNSKLSKIAGATVIAASLAVMPLSLPASAQTDPTAPTTQTSPESNGLTSDTTPLQETKGDKNYWGALGLLGLIGLANLFRKPKTVAYEDPSTVNRTTTTKY